MWDKEYPELLKYIARQLAETPKDTRLDAGL